MRIHAHHTATRLSNGKVLVVGGVDSKVNALSSAELYNPATETWTATGSLHAQTCLSSQLHLSSEVFSSAFQ